MAGKDILSDINKFKIEPALSPLKTVEDLWDQGHASEAFPPWIYIVVFLLGFIVTQQGLLALLEIKQTSAWMFILSVLSGLLICTLAARTVRLIKCQLHLPILNRQIRENDFARAEQATLDARKYLAAVFHEVDKVRPGVESVSEIIRNTEKVYEKEVYTDYWDMLEKALWQLQTCTASFSALKNSLDGYRSSLDGYRHNFPDMLVRVGDIGEVSPVLDELRKVARLGRNNKVCNQALEQRWVRKALFAGFNTVPEAVEHARSTTMETLSALKRSINGVNN